MSDPVADPVVSVVIPAYNGAALIGETLASLGEQTLTAWEALVIDDCSSDDTRELVRNWPDPRVRLIENAVNGGPVTTRNRGFAEARGAIWRGWTRTICAARNGWRGRSPFWRRIPISCWSAPRPSSWSGGACCPWTMRRTPRPN
ncbi:hypothetical protein GCM10020258_23230 [Sphingomonas yabuuchiae]